MICFLYNLYNITIQAQYRQKAQILDQEICLQDIRNFLFVSLIIQ